MDVGLFLLRSHIIRLRFLDQTESLANNNVEIQYHYEQPINRFLQLVETAQVAIGVLFAKEAQAFTITSSETIREYFAGIAKTKR